MFCLMDFFFRISTFIRNKTAIYSYKWKAILTQC